MRFKRYPRQAFTDTARKRTALARKQRLEREALPLFAAEIAAEQPAADEVMAQRAEQWERNSTYWRTYRVGKWREARQRLASYPAQARAALLAYWQTCGWPADPGYLLSMLHMFDTGRLEAVTHALAVEEAA